MSVRGHAERHGSGIVEPMAERDDLRATELTLGGRRFVVFSMSAESQPLGLTRAEAEVCVRLVAGMTLRQIAEERRTTERTVDKQVQSLYRKLDVCSRRELAARFAGIEPAPLSPRAVANRRPKAPRARAR